jgi:hypothetical protein
MLLLVGLLSAVNVTGHFNEKPERARIVRDMNAGDLGGLADDAYDQMFTVAEAELEKAGQPELALALKAEWTLTYKGFLRGLHDTGDHPPMSEWVEGWYAKLEGVLGVGIMEWTHLRDIWVLNYTIPVVFSPHDMAPWCVEQLAAHPEDTCQAEYRRHFAGTKYHPDPLADDVLHHGFSGVVTYWGIWGACEAATYGAGSFMICGPAGTAGEFVMEEFLAPKISDRLFTRFN